MSFSIELNSYFNFYLSNEFLNFFLSSSWKLKFIPESCDDASLGSIVFNLEMAPV